MLRRPSRSTALAAIITLLIPAMTGCVGLDASHEDTAIGGPGFDVRGADFFHSYYANAESYTDEFTWENPTGEAGLEARHTLEEGSVRVLVKDASGAVVFTQEWWPGTRGGQFHPGTGEPGDWTIVLERRAVTGEFDLHVWTEGADDAE